MPLGPSNQAKIANWDMGNRFPTAAQTPYFNISTPSPIRTRTPSARWAPAFCRLPALLWMQCFATKSWIVHERFKFSLRLDGHNLPWKRPNLAAPNTTYNLNNTAAWGRFTGVVGDFSNFGTAQANVQAVDSRGVLI